MFLFKKKKALENTSPLKENAFPYWREKNGEIKCPGDACTHKKCEDDCPIWLNTLAITATSLKEYQKSIELEKKAVIIAPDFCDAWINLGYCYSQLNNYLDARNAFKKGYEIDKRPTALRGLALTEKDLGNYRESMKYCMQYADQFQDGALDSLMKELESLIKEEGLTHYPTSNIFKKGNTIADTYRILSDPLQGGMGQVWRVNHLKWGIELAMKRPRDEFIQQTGENGKKLICAECESWISLGIHPNIVACFYVREIDGIPTIFSEWMEGGSLKSTILNGSLYEGSIADQEERIIDIAIQIARGLAYAHDTGLIHQDVKPDNILMSKNWGAKIADFGLASAVDTAMKSLSSKIQASPMVDSKTMLAESGGYTLAYCAPEQIIPGKKLTRRSDIYSWALSVLEMYIGGLPWMQGDIIGGPAVSSFFVKYCMYARVPIPTRMKKILALCVQKQENARPHDFHSVLKVLYEIFRENYGKDYWREEPNREQLTASLLNNRALSYLDLGKKDEANTFWTQALEINPSFLDAVYNYNLFNWRNGNGSDIETFRALESIKDKQADTNKYDRLYKNVYIEKGTVEDESLGTVYTLPTNSVRCYPERNIIIDYNSLTIYDADSGQEKGVLFNIDSLFQLFGADTKREDMRVSAIAFDHDGKYCAISAVHLTGTLHMDFRAEKGPSFLTVEYYDSIFVLIDIKSSKILFSYLFKDTHLNSLAFSPDNHRILFALNDKIASFSIHQKEMQILETEDYNCIKAFFSSNYANAYVIATHHSGDFEVWEVQLTPFQKRTCLSCHADSISISKDRKQLYILDNGALYRFSLERKQKERIIKSHLPSKDVEVNEIVGGRYAIVSSILVDLQGKRILRTLNHSIQGAIWENETKKTFYYFDLDRTNKTTRIMAYPFPASVGNAPWEISRMVISSEIENARLFSKLITSAKEALDRKEINHALSLSQRARNVPGYSDHKDYNKLMSQIGYCCDIVGIQSGIQRSIDTSHPLWNLEHLALINDEMTVFSEKDDEDQTTYYIWDADSFTVKAQYSFKNSTFLGLFQGPPNIWNSAFISTEDDKGYHIVRIDLRNYSKFELVFNPIANGEICLTAGCFSYDDSCDKIAFPVRLEDQKWYICISPYKQKANRSNVLLPIIQQPQGISLKWPHCAVLSDRDIIRLIHIERKEYIGSYSDAVCIRGVPKISMNVGDKKRIYVFCGVGQTPAYILSYEKEGIIERLEADQADGDYSEKPHYCDSLVIPSQDEMSICKRNKTLFLYDSEKGSIPFEMENETVKLGFNALINHNGTMILDPHEAIYQIEYKYSPKPTENNDRNEPNQPSIKRSIDCFNKYLEQSIVEILDKQRQEIETFFKEIQIDSYENDKQMLSLIGICMLKTKYDRSLPNKEARTMVYIADYLSRKDKWLKLAFDRRFLMIYHRFHEEEQLLAETKKDFISRISTNVFVAGNNMAKKMLSTKFISEKNNQIEVVIKKLFEIIQKRLMNDIYNPS